MKKLIITMLSLGLIINDASADVIVVDRESVWKYLDDGSDQGSAWKEVSFDDSGWSQGQAKLGFGDNDNNTTINNHQSPTETGAATWYFRTKFTVNAPEAFARLKFEIQRDDGRLYT